MPRLPTAALWVALCCGLLPAQQAAAEVSPLRVALVGDADSARSRAYLAFLSEGFAAAKVLPRATCTAEDLAGFDVLLVDWPQSETARSQRAAGWSPLGARAAHATPTVLLGSAGLNLAGAWAVRGGFG